MPFNNIDIDYYNILWLVGWFYVMPTLGLFYAKVSLTIIGLQLYTKKNVIFTII